MKTERRDSSSTNTQLHFKTQEMLKHETRRKNLFSAWLQKQTWKTKTSHPLSDARCRIKTVEQEGEREGERWTDIFKDETNVGGVWERSRRRGSPQVFGAASASHSRTGPPAWTFHQLKTFKPLKKTKKKNPASSKIIVSNNFSRRFNNAVFLNTLIVSISSVETFAENVSDLQILGLKDQ